VNTPTPQELEQTGIAAYEKVVASAPAFRPRDGQRAMAEAVAAAFAHADLGSTEETAIRQLAVVQAGTGVGKSAAYLSVGAAIAKARGKRLVISTSTVALQEQIVSKDLPLVVQALGGNIRFIIAKGRSRYVCLQKLLRQSKLHDQDDGLDFDDESAGPGSAAVHTEHRLQIFRTLAESLATGDWNGDRDTLPDPPAPQDWSAVAADRFSCTARSCPSYKTCSYFVARRELAQADVIVVNHDLLLSSIGTRSLPELDDCLLALDEAHHLPQKALEQFTADLDLTRLRWIDKAAKVLTGSAAALAVPLPLADLPQALGTLKAAHADTARMLMDNLTSSMRDRDSVRRLSQVEIDELLNPPLSAMRASAESVLSCCKALGEVLRERLKEEPTASPTLAAVYAGLGGLADRCARVLEASQLLLASGQEAVSIAKWMSVDRTGSFIGVALHASQVLPGVLLADKLWSRVRGAVLTSATMTACGSFDFFLRESGLVGDAAVRTKVVSSPFDYARQGRLVVRSTAAPAKSLDAYNAEVASLLALEVETMDAGGLALFTSKRHLEQAVEAVPQHLRERLLVQGTMSRPRLLAEHRRRVEAGQPSLLMGLQQFGEGLDLPGDLCKHLFIAKLPFASPSDPIGETRAEYVTANGGDHFEELVVPAAGVRLLQWTGRGIRTEADTTRITVFDDRLVTKGYGRRILKGLPPYPVERVAAGA